MEKEEFAGSSSKQQSHRNNKTLLHSQAVVAHTFSPSTWKAEENKSNNKNKNIKKNLPQNKVK